MEQVQGIIGKFQDFAVEHPKAIKSIGCSVGACVGCAIAVSKIGLFMAAAVGVVFATTCGAVAGTALAEVLSKQHKVQYIPPQG